MTDYFKHVDVPLVRSTGGVEVQEATSDTAKVRFLNDYKEELIKRIPVTEETLTVKLLEDRAKANNSPASEFGWDGNGSPIQ